MQKKVNMTIDYDVWENAKKIIKSEAGMSLSKYVEISLRGLIRADTGTAKDFVQDTIMDLFNASKKKEKVVIKKKKKVPK